MYLSPKFQNKLIDSLRSNDKRIFIFCILNFHTYLMLCFLWKFLIKRDDPDEPSFLMKSTSTSIKLFLFSNYIFFPWYKNIIFSYPKHIIYLPTHVPHNCSLSLLYKCIASDFLITILSVRKPFWQFVDKSHMFWILI